MKVESGKYMFEAKTVQKMELLVLTTLEWKMNPVTPLSFFDHIIRRLGLKNHLHWEFLRRCEGLLLSLLSGKQKKKNRALICDVMILLLSVTSTITIMSLLCE